MDDNRKTIVIQWMVPAGILLMVLAIMLFNFTTTIKLGANDTVTRNMTTAASACADNFREQLTLLTAIGEPVAELMEDKTSVESVYALKMLRLAMKYSGAYAVRMLDEEGLGHMLLFYPLNNFEAVIKKNDFVAWNIVALVDEDGTLLLASGTGNSWKPGDNLYDVLKSGNEDVVKKMKNRITNRVSSISTVKMGDAESALAYVPIGVNNWTLVTGISQSYIDKQVAQQWMDARNMMLELVVVIIGFIFIIIGIIITGRVLNHRKQEQLEEKADTDLLTGLNNKLATERKIKQYIEKNPKSRSMMFILDIDNFKKINDTMGHAFGDEVLRSLGQQIGSLFRASDIIGRVGGDEFFIFLKNVSADDSIRKEAKKVENFFHDFKAGEYTKYSATASIGVAIFPEEGADFESLYKAADQALYKAKERGKNQLAFYKDSWMEEKK